MVGPAAKVTVKCVLVSLVRRDSCCGTNRVQRGYIRRDREISTVDIHSFLQALSRLLISIRSAHPSRSIISNRSSGVVDSSGNILFYHRAQHHAFLAGGNVRQNR